jgi:hypothetical protein
MVFDKERVHWGDANDTDDYVAQSYIAFASGSAMELMRNAPHLYPNLQHAVPTGNPGGGMMNGDEEGVDCQGVRVVCMLVCGVGVLVPTRFVFLGGCGVCGVMRGVMRMAETPPSHLPGEVQTNHT